MITHEYRILSTQTETNPEAIFISLIFCQSSTFTSVECCTGETFKNAPCKCYTNTQYPNGILHEYSNDWKH